MSPCDVSEKSDSLVHPGWIDPRSKGSWIGLWDTVGRRRVGRNSENMLRRPVFLRFVSGVSNIGTWYFLPFSRLVKLRHSHEPF